MREPTLTDKCANKTCGHVLGMHYISYDGKHAGCAATIDDRSSTHCYCSEFVVPYRMPAPLKMRDDDVRNQGGQMYG